MDDEKYFIVYPCGDKTKLTIISLTPAMEYELNDYDVASRKSFTDQLLCRKYAIDLAKENNLEYIPQDKEYLD